MKESQKPELGASIGQQFLESLRRRNAREYALLGVAVFFLGFLLGALGSVVGIATPSAYR